MKNENEYDPGMQRSDSNCGKPPESENPYAEARHEVFNPKHVTNNAGGEAYEGSRANIELAFELQNAGMPSGLILLFLRMLWRASASLDWAVGISGLALETNKTRQSIQRSFRKLRAAGLITAVQPETRPAKWRFLKYHNLMDVVKATWGPGSNAPGDTK
jgi:hypothetical protein